MEPIAALIVQALVHGMLAGVEFSATETVKNIYQQLKKAIVRKDGKLEKSIKQLEENPKSRARQAVLEEDLHDSGLDKDREVVDLAEQLLADLSSIIENANPDIAFNASSGILTPEEGNLFEGGSSVLLEETEDINYESILKRLYERVMVRVLENPEAMHNFMDMVDEEYERDYKKEYKNYHGKAKQRKERAARTAARELMIKKGKVRKGDGKDIDHKKPLRNGGSKGINNLRVRNKSKNRSDNGHKEGEKQNKGSWK
jgi:hypothetical protein